MHLQPVTDLRRRGAVVSATARSGSYGGRECALASRRAASASLLTATGMMPASALTACFGVEIGLPVITQPAASIWTSRISRFVFAVTGIYAAAVCSMAPLTYPLATVRRILSSRPQDRPVSCLRWLALCLILLRSLLQWGPKCSSRLIGY